MTQQKEPWLAVNLSKLLPGLGEIYAGNFVQGLCIIGLLFFSILLSIYLFLSSTGNIYVAILLYLLTFLLMIWSLFNAHRCARSQNSPDFKQLRKEHADPWLGVFLSQFIPGLGHLYFKQWLLGILFILLTGVIFVIAGRFANLTGYGIDDLMVGIWYGFAAYQTFFSAPNRAGRSSNTILPLTAAIVVLIVLWPSAKMLRTYVFEARYIPSGAMEPALQINDRLIINKLEYRFHEPQRGDIIVFNPPPVLRELGYKDAFIKRIVGLPGDRIEIKDGAVFVNSSHLKESYVNKAEPTSIDTCSASGSPTFLANAQTIPQQQYLVLGDNRNNSFDGRCWGFVRRENIIGKVTKRFWPPQRVGAIPAPSYPVLR
jgi:signal peptidase I